LSHPNKRRRPRTACVTRTGSGANGALVRQLVANWHAAIMPALCATSRKRFFLCCRTISLVPDGNRQSIRQSDKVPSIGCPVRPWLNCPFYNDCTGKSARSAANQYRDGQKQSAHWLRSTFDGQRRQFPS